MLSKIFFAAAATGAVVGLAVGAVVAAPLFKAAVIGAAIGGVAGYVFNKRLNAMADRAQKAWDDRPYKLPWGSPK